MAKAKGSSSGWGKFVLGFIVGILILIAGVFAYLRWGNPPVAVADPPFPYEKAIVSVPLNARIDSQLQQPPFGTSEDVFEGGAHVYMKDCAECHGTPGHDVEYASHMYPPAPQLWKPHKRGNVVGVSDDKPGETYWKVKNGIRLTGMPAFDHVLNETQMWQVSLLLANANQQLPQPVTKILTQPELTLNQP